MAKKRKAKSGSVPNVDPYIDGLMSKLLERLVSLENKIDKILSQSTGVPASNGHASKTQPQNQASHAPQQQSLQQQRRDRVMYEAVCADCSKVCEVPFKPSEDRAVYCKECFGRRKSGGNGGNSGGNGMPKLTPVALPSRPKDKIWPAMPSTQTVVKATAKKTKTKGKKKKK